MSGGGKGRGECEQVVVCSNGMVRMMTCATCREAQALQDVAGTKVGTNRKLLYVSKILA